MVHPKTHGHDLSVLRGAGLAHSVSTVSLLPSTTFLAVVSSADVQQVWLCPVEEGVELERGSGLSVPAVLAQGRKRQESDSLVGSLGFIG